MGTVLTDINQIFIRTSFHPDPDTVVAYQDLTAHNGQTLNLASSAIRSLLPREPGGAWGIFVSSPFLLLAAMNAVQALGGKPLLLPHDRPIFLQRIQGECRGLILEGSRVEPEIVNLPSLEKLLEIGSSLDYLKHEWTQPVGFLTSGSSGEPSASFRTPAQLTAEVQMLEAAFGSQIGPRNVFCGTTSHQHLFGFSFSVLWPLMTGRPFSEKQIRIPGEVSRIFRDHEHAVLISSPAFLKRALDFLNLDELTGAKLICFSAGSPLDAATAIQFNRRDNAFLIEIYGSTETGALAFRTTLDTTEVLWSPLPGVEIDCIDGLLSVKAPHLSPGQWLTDDKVEVREAGFLLRGRRDQIVKVADKRVSISELDLRLNERPDIHEARVLLLETGELGAVIVPTPEGWPAIAQSGKSAYCQELREHLSKFVDRVTTPKRWRLVKRLPRNTQGKIELTQLQELFGGAEENPIWRIDEESSSHWVARTSITPNLPELEGHFPKNSIVPGVTQLAWAAHGARRAFNIETLSGSLRSVKFRRPLRPGTDVCMTLTRDFSNSSVQFEIVGGGVIYSSGKLTVDDN